MVLPLYSFSLRAIIYFNATLLLDLLWYKKPVFSFECVIVFNSSFANFFVVPLKI